MSIEGVKVNFFFQVRFVVGILLGHWFFTRGVSGDGLIYLWCLNNGTLIIINHQYNVIKYD